jgi:hypothetical protein
MRSFVLVTAPAARRKVYGTYIIREPTNLPTLRHLILPSKVYGFRVRLPLLYSGQTMAPVIPLRYVSILLPISVCLFVLWYFSIFWLRLSFFPRLCSSYPALSASPQRRGLKAPGNGCSILTKVPFSLSAARVISGSMYHLCFGWVSGQTRVVVI